MQRAIVCTPKKKPDSKSHPYLSKEVLIVLEEIKSVLIFVGHCPQKGPTISDSFAENDLQLEALYGSLPLCDLFAKES